MQTSNLKTKIAGLAAGAVILASGAVAPIIPSEVSCSVAGNETQFSTSDGYLHDGDWAQAEVGFKWVYEDAGVKKEKDTFDTSSLKERQVLGLRYWRDCENVKDFFTKAEYDELKNTSGIKKDTLKSPISSFAGTAEAAIALEATSTGRNSTGSSLTIAHTCTNSNSYMAVQTSVQDSNHANIPIASASYNSVTLAKTRSDEAVGNNRTEEWFLTPTTNCNGISHNVAVAATGAVGEMAVFVTTLTGTDQSTPNDANTGTSGNSAAPSIAITSITDNAWFLTVASAEATFSSNGTGQTTIFTLTDQAFENTRASYEGPKTPAGSDTQSFGLGSGQSWAITSVAIKPAAAAATPTFSPWQFSDF